MHSLLKYFTREGVNQTRCHYRGKGRLLKIDPFLGIIEEDEAPRAAEDGIDFGMVYFRRMRGEVNARRRELLSSPCGRREQTVVAARGACRRGRVLPPQPPQRADLLSLWREAPCLRYPVSFSFTSFAPWSRISRLRRVSYREPSIISAPSFSPDYDLCSRQCVS